MTGLLTLKLLCNTMVEKITVSSFVRRFAPPDESIIFEAVEAATDGFLTHAELFAQLVVSINAENFALIAIIIAVIAAREVIAADAGTVVECADDGAGNEVVVLENAAGKRYEHVFLCHSGVVRIIHA